MCDLATTLLDPKDPDAWPELLPFLFDCVRSNKECLMTSGLTIFGDLAAYATDSLHPHLQVRKDEKKFGLLIGCCYQCYQYSLIPSKFKLFAKIGLGTAAAGLAGGGVKWGGGLSRP